jgi:nucleoside-diphosphate-sugar epimerase
LAHAKSKTLAEKLIWDYVDELEEDQKFDFVILNPGFMIGEFIGTPTA